MSKLNISSSGILVTLFLCAIFFAVVVAASSEKELCQPVATQIFSKTYDNNKAYGTPSLYTPQGKSTISGKDTTIIFPARVDLEGRVVSLSGLDGSTDWTYLLPNVVRTSTVSTTAVRGGASTKSIFFGSDDGNIYSIDAETGNKLFAFETQGGVSANPIVWNANDGDFYVFCGSTDNSMYGIRFDPVNAPQTVISSWSFPTQGVLYGAACVSESFNLVAFGSTDGNIYGINAKTGTKAWSYAVPGGTAVSGSCTSAIAMINGAGTEAFFIGDSNGTLYALSVIGTLEWSFTVPASAGDRAILGAPALTQIKRFGQTVAVVIFGCADNNVYAVYADNGTLAWTFATAGVVEAAPIVSTGERNYQASTWTALNSFSAPRNVLYETAKFVYVASKDGNLTQLDAATGTKIWNFSVSGGIMATPTLDSSTGIMYFGSNNKNFYAVLAEPWCLPACSFIPPNNLVNRDIKSTDVIFAKKTISEIAANENKNGKPYELMPRADSWQSSIRSVMFHNDNFDQGLVVNGKTLSRAIPKYDSYVFLPIEQMIDWELPIQRASGNNNLQAASSCSIANGCEDILPCISPKLSNAAAPGSTNYAESDYCRYWNEAAIYALFEYTVALVTTTNNTFAQAVFATRKQSLLAAANQNKTCYQSFGTADIIANYGKAGFICNPTSPSPHFVVGASYLSTDANNNGEWVTYSFDATAYAQIVDLAESFSSGGAYISTRAADLLAGAQTFVSSCKCSSCAPYITADNNAVPWLFLICAAIKTVIVYFKFVPWLGRFKNLFLRNRTGAAAELAPEAADGTKTLKDGTKVRARGQNDTVALFRKAQQSKDEQRRINAATFYNSAEVQRRLQVSLNALSLDQHAEGRGAGERGDHHNEDLQIGRDFVKFYLTQFSAPSTSFEASSIAGNWDSTARKEKVVDVVVPDVIHHAKEVAAILAPLDKVFENLVEARHSEGGAHGISLRESQGFSGYMGSFLRFSATPASRTAAYGDSKSAKDHKASKGPLLRNSAYNNNTYGAAAAGEEQEAKTRESFKPDYGGAAENNNNNETHSPKEGTSTEQQQQRESLAAGDDNKKSKQIYYAEVRAALKNFKKAQQEHPEWFELITVVIHRSPKNPFLPSRLILAIATLYAIAYYIVSFVDAFKWFDYDRTVLAGEDAQHPGAATAGENWLRYESFAWRIMNSTVFPLLFVNCIFANWQYTQWTKNDGVAISSRVANKDAEADGTRAVDLNEDGSDDEEDLSCCVRFGRFLKSLSQHFEGRVAILSFVMMLPMILTHCLPAMILYIWLVAPLAFFFVFTPVMAINHYTALLRFELMERQYFNLGRSLKTNMSLPEGQAVPSTIYNDDVDSVKCCGCLSTQTARRRSVIYVCYFLVFFFVCVLSSWSFNIGLLYIYDANGSIYSGSSGNNGNRYTAAIGWEFESRSPVCNVITYWMSPCSTMRNSAVGFLPF